MKHPLAIATNSVFLLQSHEICFRVPEALKNAVKYKQK